MNGGFLLAFAASPAPLQEVVAAFELLRMGTAAELIRTGIALVPDAAAAVQPDRKELVDGLSDEAASELESLGDRYTEAVTDEMLGQRVDDLARRAAPASAIPTDVPAMLDEYVRILVEREAAFEQREVARANKLFTRNHALYRQLRTSAEGREGIWALREHAEQTVRLSAATHSLPWYPKEAAALLKKLDREGSFEAQWVLREWSAGRLDLDW